MMIMSPSESVRSDGLGLPKTIAGSSIRVDPMMRKSMSPPPSRIAAPAAARRSCSVAPGFARSAMAFIAFVQIRPACRTQSSSSALFTTTSSCMNPSVKTISAPGSSSFSRRYWFAGM